ncbi:gamma-glutamyltransferase [Glaciecola sp. 1036]|uniref:gamma-glutamyltransferase n=1 Tax=Alteromonadaceae TaxID=72275 RepID=UPI003CFDDA0D
MSLQSFIALFLILFVVGCSHHPQSPLKNPIKKQQQAVAMPDKFAADVAEQILDKGGNAIDAAIAAQFSLAVTFPEAGNIGGGGFMVVHYEGKSDFLDYREQAPAAAFTDMYINENGEVDPYKSIFGALASGVPGTVAGMWAAHEKYGSLPWEDLVAPAIKLAEEGFVVPDKLEAHIIGYISRLKQNNIEVNFAKYFAHAQANKVFKQPALAETLKRIQNAGRDGFYKGETARLISQFMLEHDGLITEADLAGYEAKWREPIKSTWRGYTLVSAAPPSSGGIAINQWLQMYDLVKDKGIEFKHNDLLYTHVLSEIGKRVFADRGEYLGDPDFYTVPSAALLTDDYLAQRAEEVSLDSISVTEEVKPGLPESEDTTHFSIVDKFGNAVSNTTTINLGFGSGMVVDGAGFLLNDEMDDFSAKPGVPNFFGAIGGVANEIQPHKRMLSSMTPTIVLEGNKIKMVTGSPGGTTILTSVYQSILNALEFNLPVQKVVDSPRFHHQLLPKNEIRYHSGFAKDVLAELEAMGYTTRQSRFGDLHVIIVRDGDLQAASESNGRGEARVMRTDWFGKMFNLH